MLNLPPILILSAALNHAQNSLCVPISSDLTGLMVNREAPGVHVQPPPFSAMLCFFESGQSLQDFLICESIFGTLDHIPQSMCINIFFCHLHYLNGGLLS